MEFLSTYSHQLLWLQSQLYVLLLVLIGFTFMEFIILYYIKRIQTKPSNGEPFSTVMASARITIGKAFGFLFFALLGYQLTFFTTGMTFYGAIYALVFCEFSNWFMHFIGHKVRLFWCIHFTHHAHTSISMKVAIRHNILENFWVTPFFMTFVPALFGVNPVFLFTWLILNGVWGSLLHISPQVTKEGTYGFIGKILHTPSTHRVHHAQNLAYQDLNYGALFTFPDLIMQTYKEQNQQEPPNYGSAKEGVTDAYIDSQLSEFSKLIEDVKNAPGMVNKLKYIFYPPGWNHLDGFANTTAHRRRHL